MPPAPSSDNEEPRRTSTILVVEDEPHVRELVRTVLAQDGYAVVLAASAEEALSVYHRDPAGIDLVLSDVLMPGRSGAELVTQLRETTPDLRVILMSGFTGGRVDPDQLPPDIEILEKPFKLDRLLAAIGAAFRR